MTPMDKGESVSRYVARSLKIVDESGLPYKMNPMGTVVEGEWDEVFSLIGKCFERMKEDCNRISVNIKVDYRKGKTLRLEGKIDKVEKLVGKELSK